MKFRNIAQANLPDEFREHQAGEIGQALHEHELREKCCSSRHRHAE